MRPTIEELEEALDILKKADAVGGRGPGDPITVREALDTVFKATLQQLYEAGFEYGEPPEEEER